MWTRAELKERGKTALKRNYWMCVLVALTTLTACIDDSYTTSASDVLTFSTDTVTFDTVVTQQGTVTKQFIVYNRAKKLHIDADARRVVMIMELQQERDMNSIENVRGFFGGKSKNFITAVDERNIIIVKELEPEEGYKDVDELATEMLENLEMDQPEDIHIAYGTIVNELKEVSRSYKEARMALDVGKIFFGEKRVIAYSSLGIGRLIYQLPIPLCKMFIKEIFDGKSPDDFDEETLTTIDKFFDNSLNVSETSRQLYIHRNTLVYRLDKLQKSTGLDLRVFEDAITFKIALMVVRYMKYMETLEY